MRTHLRLAVLAFASISLAASAEGPKHHMVLWSVNFAGKLTVLVNEVPVIESTTTDTGASGQLDVGEWIAPGPNTLTLKFELPGKPTKKDPDAPKDNVEVRLIPVAAGAFPEDADAVAKILWAEVPEKAKKFPFTQTVTAKLDVPPMRLWTDAEKVTLDAAAKKELTELTLTVFGALMAKDAAQVYELTAFKISDLAAYRPAPKKEAFVKGFGGMLQKVTLALLDPADLTFLVVAQGRVVAIRRKDGSAPIKSDQGVAMPLYAGRVGGTWVLVR